MYIVSSRVMPHEGDFRYEKLSLRQASKWLKENDYINTIPYRETTKAFYTIFKISLKPHYEHFNLEIGNEALVFRIQLDGKGYSKDNRFRPKYSLEETIERSEIGLITRLA